MKDASLAKDILLNSKKLQNLRLAKIYVNSDKSYHNRKEDQRLRKKKFDLSQLHPEHEIKTEKGKLYHNGTVVNTFDLNNQFFH